MNNKYHKIEYCKKGFVNNFFNILLLFLLIFVLIISNVNIGYAISKKGQNERNEVLLLAKIISDDNNMDEQVKRSDFAKMIVKSSIHKDTTFETLTTPVCTDVTQNDSFAQYVKVAIENDYMFLYLGGFFKPNENVTLNDVARACLVLLGYKNSDIIGNKVIGYTSKFREMKLDENIESKGSLRVTKLDICNAIYNTLKENKKNSNECYGLSIFDKMVKDKDGELNASELIERKMDGPYIAKNGKNREEFSIPFDEKIAVVYLNGILSKIEDVKDDLENYGYIVYYYVENENIVYAYSERTDIAATVALKHSYVDKINYDANSMVTPVSIDVGANRYELGNQEMKIIFSYAGSIKEDDDIIFIYNKKNDVNNFYSDKNGKIIYNDDDESRKIKGSIIYAYKYDLDF